MKKIEKTKHQASESHRAEEQTAVEGNERRIEMRVEEIALRQEIRQMLSEAGINKNTIREMAEKVLQEETEKQVNNLLHQINTNSLLSSKLSSYELKEMLRNVIRTEVKDSIKISVDVKAENLK